MSLATHIRPIRYLKNSAAEIVKEFAVDPEPLMITQNGEAKLVVIDIKQYEKQLESMALIRLLVMGDREIKEGRFGDAKAFLDEMDDQE